LKPRTVARVIGSCLLLAVIAWRATPAYLFFAFSDGSTLPATPWLELPDGPAPTEQAVGDPAYRATGDSLMADMDHHRAGVGAAAISAAVLIGDRLVWAGTVGWADIETATPATPATRFRIGSTSKALTATGLARLIDSGLLGFDTPLRELWDELPNPRWAEMTPRQLASHMAGLPHYGDNTDLRGLLHSVVLDDHYASVHEALELFDGADLLFDPGTSFSYSSYGTVLLSAAMSRAAGQPYLDVMHERVFLPASMADVVVSPPSADMLPALATPYQHNGATGDALRLRRWRDVDLSHRLAGGGFAATSSDLVKLGRSYFTASNPDAISAAVREEMFTPQRLDSGEINEQAYGIGWRVRTHTFADGRTLMHVNHGGVARGGQSWLMLFPEEEMAVALNINGRTQEFWDFGEFSVEIASRFLARKGELAAAAARTATADEG
jgi:CubicO group peptidase (beta-lactamase class C family)